MSPLCTLCERPAQPWLVVPGDFARPLDRTPFSLYWCAHCSYGLLWPRPDPEQVAGFYDMPEYYTHHDAEQRPHPRKGFLDRLRLHIAWRMDRGVDMRDAVQRGHAGARLRVCDIGCGNGSLLEALRGAGHQVLGIEPDARAREHCRSRGLPVVPGSAECLPDLSGERFDLVLMSHALEHTLDPLLALRNAVALVGAQGSLMVEVPNNACASLAARGVAWPWLDVPRHLNFFTPASLRAAAARVGLDVVKLEWTGYCRMFAEPWIAEEAARWDRFAAAGAGRMPRRVSRSRAWSLLARTAFSPPQRKYDSVRMLARPA